MIPEDRIAPRPAQRFEGLGSVHQRGDGGARRREHRSRLGDTDREGVGVVPKPGLRRVGVHGSTNDRFRRNLTLAGTAPTGCFVPDLVSPARRDDGEPTTGSGTPARAPDCLVC